MKKLILIILFSTHFLDAKTGLEAESEGGGDNLQIWAGAYIEGKVSDKVSAALYQEWDTNEFVHDFYYYVADTSAIFKPQKNFSCSANLRTGFIKQPDGLWIFEFSPFASFNYTIPVGKMDFYASIKTMYRTFQFRKNRGVLAIKSGFMFPVKDRIKFFIQNEFMHGYNGFHQIDENRATIGYNASLGGNISIEFSYIREESKLALARPWTGTNAIGIALKTSL